MLVRSQTSVVAKAGTLIVKRIGLTMQVLPHATLRKKFRLSLVVFATVPMICFEMGFHANDDDNDDDDNDDNDDDDNDDDDNDDDDSFLADVDVKICFQLKDEAKKDDNRRSELKDDLHYSIRKTD